MNYPTFLAVPLTVVVLCLLLGCANIVDGSMETRIRLGEAERIVSPPDYEIQIEDLQTFLPISHVERPEQVLDGPAVEFQATRTTITTTRTPRTEEQVQSILPYSPFRETLEFLASPFYLFWAIPTSSWDQWFAMANPTLNSESMWKGSRVEQITDTRPTDPLVDVQSQTDRIGTPIDVQLDELPPAQISVEADGVGTRVYVVDLLTAPLYVSPTILRASMTIGGADQVSTATLPIQPVLGERLFRAQGYLLDPASGQHAPAELGAAILRLSELGFRKRSSSLRSSSSLIFGTETMDREIASEYIAIAHAQKSDENWSTALDNITAARALDKRAHTDWDQLEADVLEKRALGSLGAGEYDLARAGLLRAAMVDPTRQQRLAPYVTMSIEATDRTSERQATQKSRDAFLAIERERADAEAALARSNAARLLPPASPTGGAPRAARSD